MPDDRVQLIITALDQTQGAFNSLKQNLTGITGQVAGVSAAFRGLLTSAPFLAIANAIRQTANAGEEYLKVSKQMGISVENLSTLKYAAEQSEASFEELTVGLKFFSKALYGVNDNGKDTTKLLKLLGVTAKDPYQALLQVADAFSKMEDGPGKAAISMELFGRSGVQMISMLNEGSEGIKKLQGEVKEFSTEAAKAADQFNDNINRLKRNAEDIRNIIGNNLMPLLNKFAMGWEIIGATAASAFLKLKAIITGNFKEIKNINEDYAAAIADIQKKWMGGGEKDTTGKPKKPAPLLPGKSKESGLLDADKANIRWLEGIKKEADEVQKLIDAKEKKESEYYDYKQKLYEDIEDLADKHMQQQKGRDEAEINLQISKIDLLEEEAGVTSETAQQRIRLTQELLALQEEDIGMLDKINDPSGWYAQAQAIEETRNKLLDLKLILAKTGDWEAFKLGLKDVLNEWKNTGQQFYDLARGIAQAMQQTFSDFFFDAMTGKLKTLGDYWRSFTNSVMQMLSQMMSRWLMMQVMTGIGSLFAAAPVAGGLVDTNFMANAPMHQGGLVMHSGGYIPRFHSGGLNNDEVPALLQRGEYVISRKGVAALNAINQGDVKSDSGGSQGTHNYFYINAVDAKSFADLVERNPGAITKILHKDQRRGGNLWR